MKKMIVMVCIAMSLCVGQAAWAAESCEGLRATQARLEANKKAATEFFQLLIGDRDYEQARNYVAEYIQHDPRVPGDGLDALVHYLETDPKFKNRPHSQVIFHNVIADGDLVCLQVRKELKDKKDGSPVRVLVEHTFRFNEDGKIAEHWSVAAHANVNSSKNQKPLW